MVPDPLMKPAIWLALTALFVVGLLDAEYRGRHDLKAVFKPAASLTFILLALVAGALNSFFGALILAGLILCAIGDVLLIPRSKKFFLAGMAAFAGGHAAYIAAFLAGGVALAPATGFAAIGAAAFSGGLLCWLWRDLGDFRLPVVGYAAIISVMVAFSVGHWAAVPARESARLAIAAAGFAISDLSVARDQFKSRAFVNRLWGLPLYYASQCLFAISV